MRALYQIAYTLDRERERENDDGDDDDDDIYYQRLPR